MKSVITGRRASQVADRANLPPPEVDSTGLLKLNPLFAWTFPFVEWYVKENNVPRNKLLDQGYRSVGDWHSTAKSGNGDTGERAGRWAGKKEKTEAVEPSTAAAQQTNGNGDKGEATATLEKKTSFPESDLVSG